MNGLDQDEDCVQSRKGGRGRKGNVDGGRMR